MIVSGVVLGVGFLIGVMCHDLGSKQIGPQTKTKDQVSRETTTITSSGLREISLQNDDKKLDDTRQPPRESHGSGPGYSPDAKNPRIP